MLRTLGGIAAIVLAIYTAALITIKANIPSARDYVIIKTFSLSRFAVSTGDV